VPFKASGESTPSRTQPAPCRRELIVLSLTAKLKSSFVANKISNQKYNVASFLPLVFYEQFKFFFNLYFLLVALSQFIPALKIGQSSTPTVRS
jgi:hypothetical protein